MKKRKKLRNKSLLGDTEDALALLLGLEATVADLGGGIDEAEVDLLLGSAGSALVERLTHGDEGLLGAGGTTLDHNPVLSDNTVANEAAEGVDVLDGKISLGGAVLLARLTEAVDLLVGLHAVVNTVLTSAGHSDLDAGRVPGTNTGDLAETLVGLAGKTGDTETGDDTLETVTLGDTDEVAHLVLGEDVRDGDLLLEELTAEVDLLLNGATVDLDLGNVGLLLAEVELLDLGVADETDGGAVLLDALDLGLNVGGVTLSVLLGVAGEGLLLGVVPVLVEATLGLLGQVLSPDGGEGAESAGGLDVANKTDGNHGGGLEDGDSLENLLLVDVGAGLVDSAGDVGHTSLVGHEGGEVGGLGGVILGESPDLTAVVLRALAREKSQAAVARGLKLAVRHLVLVSTDLYCERSRQDQFRV